jgi:hypothetical protein
MLLAKSERNGNRRDRILTALGLGKDAAVTGP